MNASHRVASGPVEVCEPCTAPDIAVAEKDPELRPPA